MDVSDEVMCQVAGHLATLTVTTLSVLGLLKVRYNLNFLLAKSLMSHMKGTSCIAVNVNYRHAPEDPYPAAVDDTMEALEWLASTESSKFNINKSRIAIGGTSA